MVEAGYSLTLRGDWKELAGDDPEQRTFASQAHDAHLVVSSMDISAAQIEPLDLAQLFLDMRLNGERQAADLWGVLVTMAEPVIVPQPWGASIAYFGHDNHGRQFNFAGFVTRKQILQTYIESPSLTGDELFAVFQEVQNGLRFQE